MKKAPEAFRTISEVAELLETPAHVLRFWESKFYQIRPVKRAGGRRYYRPDDVALINGIRAMLQEQGLTIRGAQRVLQEKGVRHVAAMGAELRPLEDVVIDTVAPPVPDAGPVSGPESGPDFGPDALPAMDDVAGSPPYTETGYSETGYSGAAQQDAHASMPSPDAGIAQPQAMESAPPEPQSTPVPQTPASPPGELPGELSQSGADQPPASRAEAPEPADGPEATAIRLPQLLRQMPRDMPGRAQDRLAAVARRIDNLLDRMSEASGAGRW